MFKKNIFLCISMVFTACTATVPKNVNNICEIFREKENWYLQAKSAENKWGVPMHVSMAIMHQESRFIADALPPRPQVLGVIPWFRRSSAYGYAQAQDGTWQDYLDSGDSNGDDRDDYSDAVDFIGWYCAISHQRLGISKWDTEKLYLAYHEGHGGYSRRSFLKKRWLIQVARKVDKKSKQFSTQLAGCREELNNKGSFFW